MSGLNDAAERMIAVSHGASAKRQTQNEQVRAHPAAQPSNIAVVPIAGGGFTSAARHERSNMETPVGDVIKAPAVAKAPALPAMPAPYQPPTKPQGM